MATPKKPKTTSTSPSQRPFLYREGDEVPPFTDNLITLRPKIPDPYPVARRVCRWGGFVLLCLGAWGFVAPDYLGTHWSTARGLFHAIPGLLLLLIGLKAQPMFVRSVAAVAGVSLLLLGSAGFFLGAPGVPSLPHLPYEPYLWVLSPGNLELGQNDHFLHLLFGAVFLFGGVHSRSGKSLIRLQP